MPIIPANGIDLYYESQGNGPRSIVFLHAFATTSMMWYPQIPAFVKAGFKVVCVDLRGHGLSSSPSGPYTLPQLSTDIHHLILGLDLQNVCLVGLSTGGRVATRLALDYPTDITELVLVSTKSEPALDILADLRELSVIAVNINTRVAAEKFYTKYYQRLTAADPQLTHKMLSGWSLCKGDGFAGVAAAIYDMESVTSRIHEIQVPTLAIAGQQDPSCHPFMAWYERTMSNCRGFIIPNSGHFMNVEQPELFNRLILAFLAGQLDEYATVSPR